MKAGLKNFILIAKIDHLSEYSQNHFEMTTVDHTDIVGRLGTIALRVPEDIFQYDYYVFNKNLRLVQITANFVPENKQIVILLNRDIQFSRIVFSVVTKRILEYLGQFHINKFLSQVPKSFYRNLALAGFSLDVLPPSEDATIPPKPDPILPDSESTNISSGSSESDVNLSISSGSSSSSQSSFTSTSTSSSQSSQSSQSSTSVSSVSSTSTSESSSISSLSSISSYSSLSSGSSSSSISTSSQLSFSTSSSSSQSTDLSESTSVSSQSESSASELTLSKSESSSSSTGSFSSKSSSSYSSGGSNITDWDINASNSNAVITNRTFTGRVEETALSTRLVTDGQWYAEIEILSSNGSGLAVGVVSDDINVTDSNALGFKGSNYELVYNRRTDEVIENGVVIQTGSGSSSSSSGSIPENDIIGILINFNAGTNGQATLRLNGVNIITRDLPEDDFLIAAEGTLSGTDSEGRSRFRIEQFTFPLPIEFDPYMPADGIQSSASESSATESTDTSNSSVSLSSQSTSSSSSNTFSSSSSSDDPSTSSSSSQSTSSTSPTSRSSSSNSSISSSSSSSPFESTSSTSSSSNSSLSSNSSSSETSLSSPSASSVSSVSVSSPSTSSDNSSSSTSSDSSISNQPSASTSSSSGEIAFTDEDTIIETQMMVGNNLLSSGENIWLTPQICGIPG